MPKKTAPELDLQPETVDELVTETELPVPKPGDADFDWVKEYGTDEVYIHTFSDGTVVGLKSFKSIFSKTWLWKIRNLQTDIDVELAAIERGSCDRARRVLASLDDSGADDPIDELFKAWSQDGTSRGEGDEGLTPGN